MAERKAVLQIDGKTVEFPVYSGTYGYDVIDIKSLGGAGVYTLDAGFYSTAACQSSITYIDGNQGILLYRGYPINQLADRSDYISVCYLLMNGELPNESEKKHFLKEVLSHMPVNPQIERICREYPRDVHPMAMLLSMVGSLSAFYHNALDIRNPEHRRLSVVRMIAKMPTLAAMGYRHALGAPFVSMVPEWGYAENFLHLLKGKEGSEERPDPILSRALDRIFTLHADHEQNASTSTVRVAGSTGADPYACIAAGVAALWGPAHGGANEACLNMLNKIGDESKIGEYIARAKDPNDPFRLMGFGHRVYKNYDPRARVMQETCHEVLERVGRADEPLFRLARKLEKIALEDDYFVSKKLYPNVDFYSGLTLSALGIPTNMFTVIFALSRTVGWASHWMEMMNDPSHALCRPRQLYTGAAERNVP